MLKQKITQKRFSSMFAPEFVSFKKERQKVGRKKIFLEKGFIPGCVVSSGDQNLLQEILQNPPVGVRASSS